MKPLNLLALLLFLAGAGWALTRSERTVRGFQATYYRMLSPFLTAGSELETRARAFLDEVEHSQALEAEVFVEHESDVSEVNAVGRIWHLGLQGCAAPRRRTHRSPSIVGVKNVAGVTALRNASKWLARDRSSSHKLIDFDRLARQTAA